MKRIPWKKISAGCGIVTVLVLIRCIVTAARALYYGGDYWMTTILADPWFYVGMAAAAVCAAALVMLLTGEKQKDRRGT